MGGEQLKFMKKIIAGMVIICALTISSPSQARIPTITCGNGTCTLGLFNGSFPVVPLDYWVVGECEDGRWTYYLPGAGWSTPGDFSGVMPSHQGDAVGIIEYSLPSYPTCPSSAPKRVIFGVDGKADGEVTFDGTLFFDVHDF